MSYILEQPSGEVQIPARSKAYRRLRKRMRAPRVLLIDDDPAIRTLCSVSLRALSEAVGLDRPVWAAISARVRRGWSISARRTCSSVSDRSSSNDGFAGGTTPF